MEGVLPNDKILYALVAGALVKYGIYYSLHRKKPRNVKRVASISSLVIYPIKSCHGVDVPEAECTELGLKYGEFRDRHWMIATGHNNKFLTQRQEPKLTLIKPSFHGDTMHLDAPGMDTVVVPVKPPAGAKILPSNCWEDYIETYDCGETVSTWLSTYLKMSNMRLLYTAPNLVKRQVIHSKKKYVYKARDFDMIAMPDYSNYMLASEDSLVDLNTKLPKPIPMKTFRANIHVEGNEPFSEDKWGTVCIGDAKFQYIKECTRCILTLVDQDTAEVSTIDEPLKTLRSYRLTNPEYGNSPCFGVCFNIDLTGHVKVGDAVYAVV